MAAVRPPRRLAALLTLVLAGLLAGCRQPAAPAATPAPPAAAPPAAPEPAPAPAPEKAQQTPASGTAQPTPAAPAPEQAPEPPQPPIKWVVKTRHGPVVSDDPAARGKKVVLLTFDDGPHPEYTPRILDILKAHHVKALWFVTGNAGKYPELVKRIDAEGHLVGTHTLYHENLVRMTREQQRRAIVAVNEMVEKAIGKKPRYFRPPFGQYNDDTLALMQELGMQLINWDHGSGDWMEVHDGYKDPRIVVQDVLSETPRNNQMTPLHPGSIILFHDTLRHTAEALPEILAGLKAKGYEFVLLEP